MGDVAWRHLADLQAVEYFHGLFIYTSRMTFSPHKFKAARKRRKMTQQQLADAAGWSQVFVARLETARRALSDSAVRAAKILRCRPEDFFDRSHK